MSKTLRLIFLSMLTCVVQTTLVRYIRIGSVAPDVMIATLVALTSTCGSYGGFCVGSLMAMLYDASVGYVLAINLVCYTFIGWAAPLLRRSLEQALRRLKHKSYLVLFSIGFFLTLLRELVDVGYLFLIGSELGLITPLRSLVCCVYSAVMVFPATFCVRRLMTWKPKFMRKKKDEDFIDDKAVTEPPRKGSSEV